MEPSKPAPPARGGFPGPVVIDVASGVDGEGRPLAVLRGGGDASQPAPPRPALAKVCYGVLLYTRADADAQQPPVRRARAAVQGRTRGDTVG